jgi:hypothetical protein
MRDRQNRHRAAFRPLAAAVVDHGLVERDPRRAVSLGCTVTVAGSNEPAFLETVSYRGFGLRCRTTLALGMPVLITLPGIGGIGGQVRWSFCGRAGGTFERALDEREVVRLQALSASEGAHLFAPA